MLNLDAIDLSTLAEALDDHSDLSWWWFDPNTGQINFHSDDVDDDLDLDEVGGIAIEPTPSHESYRDLEDFTALVRDPRARDRLERAIVGRGAFRRFKDTVHEFPELPQAWHSFHDNRASQRAVQWLLDENLIDEHQGRDALDRFADPRLPELSGAVDP